MSVTVCPRPAILAALLASALSGTAMADSRPGVAPDPAGIPMIVPGPPGFQLPAVPAGTHSVRELQQVAKPLLGTDVTVVAYVTFIYDCAADVARPKESRAATRRRVAATPEICKRPRIHLGDLRETSGDGSMWVVDFPRPANAQERKFLPPAELAARPPVPKVKLGDYVAVTGHFALASAHGDSNSDGLLVYSSLAHAKAPTAAALAAARTADVAPIDLPWPPVPVPTAQVIAPVTREAAARSRAQSQICAEAYGRQQYDPALAACTAAVTIWAGNHAAWYRLASLRHKQGNETAAAEAAVRAAALVPTESMYELMAGWLQFEAAVAAARITQHTPTPDLTAAPLAGAERALRIALDQDAHLWRAHYYLGRIARAQGRVHDEARELTAALEVGVTDAGPLIALTRLYTDWGYTERAMAICGSSARFSFASSDYFYQCSLAYASAGKHTQELEQLNHALALDPHSWNAQFARAQHYQAAGDYAHSKPDYEAVISEPAAGAETVAVATRQLADIAAAAPTPPP